MTGHPLWNNAIVAMHMDGADGSTTFTNLKGAAFARYGSPIISTVQSVFGGASARFDGASYLYSAASALWDLGTMDLHLSLWFYIAAPASVDGGGNRPALLVCVGSPAATSFRVSLLGDATTTGTGISVRGTDPEVNTFFSISAGAWHYLSLDRFNGTLYLSLDGAIKTSFSYPAAVGTSTADLFIGGRTFAGSDMRLNGYIDDLLFIAGAALNTSAFSPPATPFDEGFEVFPKRVDRPGALLVAGSPVWRANGIASSARLRDLEHDGVGRVIGTTKNTGSPDYPVSRRVRLARKRDGVLARETWSDAAGNYLFEHVRHDIEYVVTAHDHTGLYNAVIADSVTPELMP